MEETKEVPCMICSDPVQVSLDIPEDEPVLCIIHWFTEDPSEDWELDEDE